MIDDLVIGMAGSGGDGIVSAGESLIAAAALEGYHAILTKSFGSQIRGGESSCRLRVSTQPVLNPGGTSDCAVALNWEDFLKFGGELPVGRRTVVIYEQKTGITPSALPLKGVVPETVIAVPIEQMALASTGTLKAKNVLVLGLLAGWFGLASQSILEGIRRKFGKKGAEILAGNERAFSAGLEYSREKPLREDRTLNPPRPDSGRKLLTDGNDLCGAAAIFAGCKFFGGYPITPSSEIMHFLNREIWKYGGSVLQAEDEIAGIGAVVGASFAGIKAMTATSGPGLSLKAEVLGLATIAELPLVCVNVQRGGPSTGIPTKSEQSDLFAAAFSAHGDVVRPVLAPTNVEEIFGLTVEAFNIAERYQTPVIVLSDQEIAQRKETVNPLDLSRFALVQRHRPAAKELEHYLRFRLTESGVSPISHPGLPGGNYLASGIEHNEKGAPTANGEIHARMNDKRFRKLQPLKRRADLFLREGDEDALVGVISWGSVAGVVREAVHLAMAQGIQVKLLVPKLLYPIAEEVYQEFFASLRQCLVVEQSHQGQLYRLIRMWASVPEEFHSLARSGSNPISPVEVCDRIREMALLLQRRPQVEPETDIG